MTQRKEVRFKVYTQSSIDIFGDFPLELIDFLEGDGTYDTTTYKYSVQNAGTYLLGISYNKRGNPNNGVVDMLVSGKNYRWYNQNDRFKQNTRK